MPNLRGDLEGLMGHRPVFRTRMQGYDRLEVDNYAAWAEGELVTARREADHLLSRFGECSAELEISRRLLADAPPGREAFPVSQRVREMLRLAEDEAAAITDAGAQEAEHLLAEARTEAAARLRKAHEIKEVAVDAADKILEQARHDRAGAAAAVERVRAEGAGILREAAVERDRLSVQAAQERQRLAAQAAQERQRLAAQAAREREEAATAASARLAGVQAEVDDLRRQRDQARQSLRGLTERLGEALEAVAATGPDDMCGTNVAVEGMGDGMVADDVHVLVERPARVPS
jgi:cell division septum initiation protein DivIVA